MRFLLISLTGYVAYSALLVLLLNLAPTAAHPQNPWLTMPSVSWHGGKPWSLPLAYAVGTLLAACVCLPSFYFYSLLAGVRLTWLQITSVVGKGMAANAILLLGLGPIYLAAALGMIVLDAPLGSAGDTWAEALEAGDVPGVCVAVTDGVVRFTKSRNTPAARRSVGVTGVIPAVTAGGH